MNQEAIDLLITKNPKLKQYQESLKSLQPGSYIMHRSWGLGKIKEYDEKLNKLIVDFEDSKKDHSMDPVFCIDKLDILPPSNILVRQKLEPTLIDEIINKRPTDLIVEVLSHCADNAASSIEIENILNSLLGPKKYKKWWTATKKLLVKDPRIAVPAKKTEPYFLRDEPVKAEDELLEDFFEINNPKKKIALAEKLLNLSVAHDDIKEALPEVLKTLTVALQETKRLNQGERLHGIWVRNDLARNIHEDVELLQPTSMSILQETENLSLLAEEMPNIRYKRFLDLIERTLKDEWEKVVIDLLRNSSGRFTSECVNFLVEKERLENLKKTLVRWLDEQTIKGPIIFWLIKNRNSRKYANLVHDLINPRMFHAILYAIDYEALQNDGNRRIPLADYVSDEKDLVGDLLSEASIETANDLATTLILNQGFEELNKKSLLARFIKQFPSVQNLVAGDASGEKSEGLVVSKESYDLRKHEYDDLVANKIPENKRSIVTAREHGDLKENSEYKMARQEQDVLMARKSNLEIDLMRAETTDFSNAPSDCIGIGNIVELLQASTNQTVKYSILGAWDSEPENNILSYQTPLGESLISKTVGESVKINIDGNEEVWTVKSISRWVDRVKS